jgi:hypothetical protein
LGYKLKRIEIKGIKPNGLSQSCDSPFGVFLGEECGGVVIPKLAEESCDVTSLNFLRSFTALSCRCPFGQRFLGYAKALKCLRYDEMTMAECLNDWSLSCHPERSRRIPWVYRTPFVVLRGGKGNRHYGHRSRRTYALTHLTPPKQRTVLFGKCGVRPSIPLHSTQDDNGGFFAPLRMTTWDSAWRGMTIWVKKIPLAGNFF